MVTKLELLNHIDVLLRSMPDRSVFRHDTPDNLSWLGQAQAVVEQWDGMKGAQFAGHVRGMRAPNAHDGNREVMGIIIMLNQARTSLMLETGGGANLSVPANSPYTYFDEIRKHLARAREEVFFIDPYLDAEFLSTYLPHVPSGVKIRLLTTDNYITRLLPAAELYLKQHRIELELRTKYFHDRLFFLDNKECFHSSSSFKDGGKSPSLVVQVTDAFIVTQNVYEDIWIKAKEHIPSTKP